MKRALRFVLATMLAMCCGSLAFAQKQVNGYPSRPIKIIVPAGAGGGGDTAIRAVARGVGQRTGWSIIVENRPGANGVIGTMAAAGAAPDGYTLYMGAPDAMEINPHLSKLKYDPIKSFDPILPIGRYPLVLCVRSDFPANSVADLLKIAKESPGKVTYGSWGIGSIAHLIGLLLEQYGGVHMLHVPYTSGSAAHMALISKQVDILVMAMQEAVVQQKAGQAKMLAVTAAHRSRSLPELPTLAELGYPVFAFDQWVALFAPAGTPRAIRDLIAKEVNGYLQSPEGQKTFQSFGYETIGGSTEDLQQSLLQGNQRWEQVIKERNIQLR